MTVSRKDGYYGPAMLTTGGDLYNALDFMVDQKLARRSHAVPVEVIAVKGGGPGATAIVTVKPLVDQQDGIGNRYEHAQVYDIPVARSQTGASGIIHDPSVGDHGQLNIQDRDISTYQKTGKGAGPGSWRQNSMSDGIFQPDLSSMKKGPAMTNYLWPNDDEGLVFRSPKKFDVSVTGNINLVTTGNLVITAHNATLDAAGNLTVRGDVIAGSDGVSLHDHRHRDTQPGGGLSGVPQATGGGLMGMARMAMMPEGSRIDALEAQVNDLTERLAALEAKME